ncbi:DegT/DnrJ/EryC1/StrS family aminotransferase [Marinomonas sp. BSi20584]|uniref:DegT/DnrJ/EryC1/StrS family aminotransferase n=1 Tax=Marinomonas sp. BSi20584 TaxID=1594462 RepID=UPI000C1E8184|nr:DegT/DnrJ/EryC1/StrS family aminotransferase [Marinomonas sp. BSi20584]PJE53279.1 perosamine synthetase [Marinomonas sp. BSi20584]
MSINIPIYQPLLTGNEKKYVNDCLDSNWISSKGKYVQEFERKFAEYNQVKYATTVSNGTVALHLAMVALGIGLDDEVIVPTLTYIASVNTIAYTGATPVFVDSDKDTWQINPEDVKRKITPKTKAIMVVHLYGHPCDMDAIMAIANEHNLFVIEDCAEAFGSKYKDQYVGTFGHISTFSFFGNKTITTGEGGMVVTNDQTLYQRCVHFKGQGLAEHRQYWHDVIGFNYRMTNICAAIGLAQLEQADDFIAKKRQIAEWYKDGLKDLPLVVHQESAGCLHTYWMVNIVLEDDRQRDPLREHLADAGIETRPMFYPVHTMPMYSQKFQRHPVAEDLGWRGINIPSWPGLSENDVKLVCKQIKDYFGDC